MKLISTILVILLSVNLYAATNEEPIVLVHGFTGWDRDEMNGYKYWGGLGDIQEEMKERGFDVRTAAVGPISSNWDRACELYAYIKGGAVDYGKYHSQFHNHKRFGRKFEGLYPEWDSNHKIHLIGHSMGGTTIRLLAHLLESGHPDKSVLGFGGKESSPLFDGDNDMITSITSISTPHKGTTLTHGVNSFLPLIQSMVFSYGKAIAPNLEIIYDLKLDQWSLLKFENENTSDYFQRISAQLPKLNNLKDFSKFDLSPQGMDKFNSWVKDSKKVFYSSWSTEASMPALLLSHNVPKISMNPLFYAPTIQMGRNGSDDRWYENDGIVNTFSMTGPDNASVVLDGRRTFELQKGTWYHMGVLRNVDHMDVVGVLNSRLLSLPDSMLYEWYEDLMKKQSRLERHNFNF